MNWMVNADLPTAPPPTTTSLYSLMKLDLLMTSSQLRKSDGVVVVGARRGGQVICSGTRAAVLGLMAKVVVMGVVMMGA